jgi:predicted nucleotidyltransferase
VAPYSIEELKNIIIPIAMQHGVKSVSIFGSYSRGTASAKSDLDLKIEKGELRSLFQLSAFRLAVEDALNLSVDLVTSEASDENFLDMIAKEEVLLYRSA